MSSTDSSLPSPDLSHGLSSGLATVAIARGWTMSQGLNVPWQPQLEAGVACGASAVVADTLMKDSDVMIKAGATGAILSGVMWAWKNDQNVWLWFPVGAASYYVSDMAMQMYKKGQEKKGLGRGGHGRRQDSSPSSDVPVVPGM